MNMKLVQRTVVLQKITMFSHSVAMIWVGTVVSNNYVQAFLSLHLRNQNSNHPQMTSHNDPTTLVVPVINDHSNVCEIAH